MAVNTAESPKQYAALKTEIEPVTMPGLTLTAKELVADLEQTPTAQTAVYVVLVVGLTVMVSPVSVVDQVTMPLHPAAVSIEDSPSQISKSPLSVVASTTTTLRVPGSDVSTQLLPFFLSKVILTLYLSPLSAIAAALIRKSEEMPS